MASLLIVSLTPFLPLPPPPCTCGSFRAKNELMELHQGDQANWQFQGQQLNQTSRLISSGLSEAGAACKNEKQAM